MLVIVLRGPAKVGLVALAFVAVLAVWKCLACDPVLGCPTATR
jgi:hypothetical protein